MSRKSFSAISELLHADGRTDMTKPIVAFHNFSEAHSDQYFSISKSV